MRGKTHCLEVWGNLACFTRPEMKVERYSYPCPTPSAARGIFDAIYWKRSRNFYWQIEKIEVLNPIRYVALRRNEVKDKAPSDETILKWRDGKAPIEPIYADGDSNFHGVDTKGRTQRQTVALKNVRYRIQAHIVHRTGGHEEIQRADAQFVRRAGKGQCFYRPFLGCKEFVANFSLSETVGRAVDESQHIGWMLYDIFDLKNAFEKTSISVFRTKLERGTLLVPPYESDEIRKGWKYV